MKIAIAGTGYVGLANAILLAQHNRVVELNDEMSSIEVCSNICKKLTFGGLLHD